MPSEMPDCLCCFSTWQPGDSQFGPGGSFQWFTCAKCGVTALSVYYDEGVVLMTSSCRVNFTETELSYVNGPLMTALRFRHMRLDEAREVLANRYWDRACDTVGVPRGTRVDRVPEDKLQAWREAYRYNEDPQWRNPSESGEAFIPPQVPSTLVAFTRLHGRWRECAREETARLLVPLDPIRIRHDEYWEEVFKALAPLADIKPLMTDNEYCGSRLEPWYQFDVNGALFTVGPRKRVANIRVVFPDGPTPDLSGIAAVARRDDVTFEMGSHGGIIHAWNKFRLVEYLTILIGVAKQRSAVATPASV